MNNFLPFSLPDLPGSIGAEVPDAADSFDSGRLTSGQNTQRLERSVVTFLRSSAASGESPAIPSIHALSLNTNGLQLALQAMGVEAGDEVITSPYIFTTTAGILRQLGARPIFVDINPVTLNIDHRKIERAITGRTKVILPVHIGGLACEMEPILDLAWRSGLRVVEDAAQAMASTYRGRPIGTLGSDATVFSFQEKTVEGAVDGGIIVTCNPEVAGRCRVLRMSNGNRTGDLIAHSTDRAGEIASTGILQMRSAWQSLEQRSRMAARYDAELGDLPVTLPTWAPAGDIHSWNLYSLRLDDSLRVSRDEFIRLMAKRGIECGTNLTPLHIHPYWGEFYQLQPHQFPAAWRAYERVVSLPIHTRMSNDDQGRVIEAVREVIGQVATRPRNSLFFGTKTTD